MNPEFFFAESVVARIGKKEKSVGRSELNDVENAIISVWDALGLVGNGGIQYWLLSDRASSSIIGDLRKMELESLSAVMDRVFRLLPEIANKSEREKETMIDKHEEMLAALTHDWFQASKAIEPQIATYMRQHWDDLHDTIVDYFAFWV